MRAVARELKASGMTYAQIGERLGVSRQRAQQLVAPTPLGRKKIVSGAEACAKCGAAGKLDLHHSSYDNQPDELLCVACHRSAHAGDVTTEPKISARLSKKVEAALADKAERANSPTSTKVHGSLYWDTWLMEAIKSLANEQGRSFNDYMAIVAEQKVAAVERRRQRKPISSPEAA